MSTKQRNKANITIPNWNNNGSFVLLHFCPVYESLPNLIVWVSVKSTWSNWRFDNMSGCHLVWLRSFVICSGCGNFSYCQQFWGLLSPRRSNSIKVQTLLVCKFIIAIKFGGRKLYIFVLATGFVHYTNYCYPHLKKLNAKFTLII